MDDANTLGPATLGTLNGTGFMNVKPGEQGGYVQNEGTFIVAGSSREEVEALRGDKLDYFGPTEEGDKSVAGCQIDSLEDFPTLIISGSSD